MQYSRPFPPLDAVYGQLPELEYNGERISQSIAIARFLAREFNLAGKDNVEAAKCDALVDACSDLLNGGIKFKWEKDEARKAENQKKFEEESLVDFAKHVEKLISSNGDKFVIGKELTWADTSLAVTMSNVSDMFAVEWRSKAPKIAAHQDMVYALPNIKKWIESRPKNSM